MNCRASTRRIGIHEHIDAGYVPETEPVFLSRLLDSIEILTRNPHVHIRGETRLFWVPLEDVNENTHASHNAVGNARTAKSCVKTP